MTLRKTQDPGTATATRAASRQLQNCSAATGRSFTERWNNVRGGLRNSSHMDPRTVAQALGGESRENKILAPGPGHSKRDRSMSVRIDPAAPEGFVVASFAGDDPFACRDYIRQRLGLPAWSPHYRANTIRLPPKVVAGTGDASDVGTSLALRVFEEARGLNGTLGETYLRHRLGGYIPSCDDLRFHAACVRRIGDKLERRPALIALLRDIATNEPRAIQRIFLLPDGSDRLRDPMGKATLGSAKGAVVKLTADEDVTLGLGITEGVETGLALMARGWSPIWATTGTSGMAAFPVLDGIDALTVFADHDESGAGDAAAAKAIVHWREAGREARGLKPRLRGDDWADVSRRAA